MSMFSKFTNEKTTKTKILVFMFGDCNNACDFCFQKTYRLLNIANDNFIDVHDQNMACLQNLLDRQLCNVTVNLMGGEPFANTKTISILNQYVDLLKRFKDIKIRITTNLLHDNIESINSTIQQFDSDKISLYTSFDFGNTRFKTSNCLDKFIENFKNVVDIAKSNNVNFGVETIRTKQMLNSLKNMDKQALAFKYITENADVCLNELIPGDLDLLTGNESVELWKLLIDNFKTSDIKSHFTDNGRNCFNCIRYTIANGNIVKGCAAQKNGSKFIDCAAEDKRSLALNLINHYKCITCKHGDICSMHCLQDSLYDECDIRQILDDEKYKEILK